MAAQLGSWACAEAAPGCCAGKGKALEVRLGLQLFAALMLSHRGSGRAPVCACNTHQVKALRLPQLTGARCTALQGTSAGISRVNLHSRRRVPLSMQEQQPQPNRIKILPSCKLTQSISADAGRQHAAAARREVTAAPARQPRRLVRARQ